MNKFGVRLVSLIMTLVMFVSCFVVGVGAGETVDSGDYRYTLNDNGMAVIDKYLGSASVVQIPEYIDGHRVVKLDDWAFENNEYVTDVTMPDSVEEMDSFVFQRCKNLKSVKLSNNLKEIPALTFMGCVSLKSLDIPNGVEKIGQNAFGECISLEKVTIPDSVVEIDYYAFKNCESLKSLTLSKNMKKIWTGAFRKCTGLESIVIPEGVTRIGADAFHGCSNLRYVVLPESLEYVEEFALNNNQNRRLYFKGDHPKMQSNNIQDYTWVFYKNGTVGWSGNPIHGTYFEMFADVNFDAWYLDSVGYAISHGLMNGTSDTEFKPNADMDRAMLVTVLWRLEGSPASSGGHSFTDINADWYADAVSWAYNNGIVTGTSATTFSPDTPVSREQTATILYRYAEYKNQSTDASAELSDFPDEVKVSDWARSGLSWAVGEGFINGTSEGNGKPAYLTPKGSASRAQVATILMRFCDR